MNSRDLKPGALFTKTGNDVWKLKDFYPEPSCTLINLETKEELNFGMGGLTAQAFKRLIKENQ